MNKPASSILNHPAVSGHYLFPQSRFIKDPFVVDVGAAELTCYRRIIDLNNFTIIHFHGNGESVSDYVPDMADMFEELGLNSLFVEQPATQVCLPPVLRQAKSEPVQAQIASYRSILD